MRSNNNKRVGGPLFRLFAADVENFEMAGVAYVI